MTGDLLGVAETLIDAGTRRPHDAHFRRAISTAYYALFDALAASAADVLVGAAAGQEDAWSRVYRAVDHGAAKASCAAIKNQQFGVGLTTCAEAFIVLQEARHSADYDPLHAVDEAEARLAIDTARLAIDLLRTASDVERRRMAVHLLFRKR